jgi:hypothetical protein
MTVTDPHIELLRGATVYPLHQLISGGLMRIEEDGVGLPPVQRLIERGPLQHGDTDVGFRLQPRIISLVLVADGDDDITQYWQVRRGLQRMLRPSSVPLSLRYTLPTSEVRQIDVVFAAGLGWGSADRSVLKHRAAFQLRAADPTWYDPTPVVATFGLVGSGDWEIPWAIPWNIGAPLQTQFVVNPGDWEANPIITITGPIINPVVTNFTTDEKLDFTGRTLTAGQSITIDTRYGFKTVKDQGGVSRLEWLSEDSDLATFRIAADPDAAGGVNQLQVSGTGLAVGSSITVVFPPRYVAL